MLILKLVDALATRIAHRKLRSTSALLALVLAAIPWPALTQPLSTTKTAAAAASAEPLAQIVAIVEKDVLTRYDLELRKKVMLFQLRGRSFDVSDEQLIDKQVLERMIYDRVQLLAAKDAGYDIDETALNQAIKRIAADRAISVSDLQALLAKSGLTFDYFKQEIKNEIVIARLREREIGSTVQISDADVDNYLATAKNAAGGTQYRLAHILIKTSDKLSSAEVRQLELKAKQMYRRIQIGQPFADVARQFSDAPDAADGGDLGWRALDKIPVLFAKMIRDVKVGEVSDVIRSDNGFHVVKLVDKKDPTSDELITQTHVRHILVRENELLSEQDAEKKLQSLRNRLVGGADFAELARMNSQDGSAARGGDLGWTSPGDLNPDFEKAMNALAIKEISPVVKTVFGYHLIEVLERRQVSLGEQKARQNARAVLYETKADEAYDEWLRQLRDRSYIDNRLETQG